MLLGHPLFKWNIDMADNYLEKKMEQFRNMPDSRNSSSRQKIKNDIRTLVAKCKPFRSFSPIVIVREKHLEELIELGKTVLQAMDMEYNNISFCHITESSDKFKYDETISEIICKKGELFDLSQPDKLPKAFIIISYKGAINCSGENTGSEGAETIAAECSFAIGTAAQTILLRATEMGFGGRIVTIVCSSERASISGEVNKITAIIAVGKGE